MGRVYHEIELVDPLSRLVDGIRVEVGVGADAELAEDGRGHGHAYVAQVQGVGEEVVGAVEVQLVQQLDYLGAGPRSIREIADLGLEVIGNGEACTGSSTPSGR